MNLFKAFFQSEKSSGFILIGCTVVSLLISNSVVGDSYVSFFQKHIDLSFAGLHLNHSIAHWINDGLMTVFFLLVGLEIERELYVGELSSMKKAMLPILAAAGGMLVPALIHLLFNKGTNTQAGFGIPMATDIAFALGILSLAGNRIPLSLKIFLTALAIIDDLGAITVIAIFYATDFSLAYSGAAIGIFILLYTMGRLRVYRLAFYLIPGIVMWYCMMQSGIHATIAGVLLAFAIPFPKLKVKNNPSWKLQHALHLPVAFFIMPVFALANTAIQIPGNAVEGFATTNSLGIMLGLLAGKFIGIMLFCFVAVKLKLATLADDIGWKALAGVALLAGIGFTMSIFIANLAFTDEAVIIQSKLSVLVASVVAAIGGLMVLSGLKATGLIMAGEKPKSS
ncbi:MAG: Na+/H+ antiporter NhaA [Bacteroidota bacterium]